ncbi:MAG: MFS transporter [Desulfohalobiaceae bacterium]|nr:MFS transporter [Desulfohalobiaceae bacterium]
MRLIKDPNLAILLCVVMFAVTGGSLVGPILPEMISPLGATQKTIGWALSVYTLLAMLSTPILGMVADLAGRKRVIVFATILFGVAGLLITFSRAFWLVLVLRGLQGIGVGGMMNTVVAALGDLYTGVERNRAMGYRVTAQSLTNSSIPFVSGVLATVAWFFPFYIHSLAILAGLVAAWKLQETARPGRQPGYLRRSLSAAAKPRAIWIFFSNFMGFFLLYCIVVYMPIYVVRELSLTTAHAGLALSVGSGVVAIISTQAGRLRKSFREEKLIFAGLAGCGLALLLMGLSQSYIGLLSVMLIWGLGFGTLMPALNAAAAGLVSSELRAGFLSVFTLLIYLGQTVSPPFFALFIGRESVEGAFFAGGTTALLPLLVTLVLLLRKSTGTDAEAQR